MFTLRGTGHPITLPACTPLYLRKVVGGRVYAGLKLSKLRSGRLARRRTGGTLGLENAEHVSTRRHKDDVYVSGSNVQCLTMPSGTVMYLTLQGMVARWRGRVV